MKSNAAIEALASQIRHNCHIADARQAGDYTLCVYLLKMRELYRWEQGLPYGAPLGKDEVGAWLSAREELWERVQDQPYRPLRIGGEEIDPFDSEAVNRFILEQGYIYSAGLGQGGRAHFFLGRLLEHQQRQDCALYVAGSELARDLTAPPAMARPAGDSSEVLIRRESVRRMIWERVEEWQWQRRESPMARALAYYPVDEDLETALDALTARELEVILAHELGELEAGALLGPGWRDLLAALPPTWVEAAARAVKDHLADCLSTLPALIESGDPASIHFYFGNFRGQRQLLFPALRQAYDHWVGSGDLEPLRESTRSGRRHWEEVANDMLRLWRARGADGLDAVAEVLEHAAR